MSAEAVRAAVGAVRDPEIRRPLSELDMLDSVEVADGVARVALSLTVVGCPAADRIERDVRDAAARVEGVRTVEVELGVMAPARRAALSERLRGERTSPFGPDSLTRVIAVTSGKGGVGKSTVTANLAVALAARGLGVGVLDADVHGFSIPGLLGIAPDTSPVDLDGLIVPPVAFGVKAISIGMFLPPGERDGAVAWRGPMLHRTLNQFLTDVHYGAIDVLLVDTPPGTGDVAISLGQLLPNAEVLVVTTPQPAAADVAVRSGLVARKLGQRLIGVVETMAPATLPDGSLLDLFGSGGGAAVAQRLDVPLLASVPLSAALRRAGDAGAPVVSASDADPAAAALDALAAAVGGMGRGLGGRRLPVGPA
ncbi:Mrp/NBP35 family ATP-binding protein [Amnibacterium kyonggiense]|uniref:Iron-sulfur cluster carrier protein n=1 Tax=Amnibacterium kyonggiense TaxID=595671 RepID=A0A4V3EAD9_9MICO|nr:Mrp/NBP35 family ATP-binding protein [Amnibacterium kyonggiense]TDS75978.1 ATP-binding protein involved in chromosome partitioning [Amnibacterium kyonggiense]